MSNSSNKMPETGVQALIFGASGITGWAITNSALSYPTTSTFSQVVGLTSRPLSLEASGLPSDERLQLYSGLDLSQDAEAITKYLKKIKNVEQITHVYFAVYVHRGWGDEGSEERIEENVDFIVNAVAAVEAVCPNLQFWTFPTGGKWYGFEFGKKVARITPQGKRTSLDTLAKLSEGKSWKFADIRPDAIVGFVPNHNPMNLAEPLALYASLWKSLSSSTKIPFPGTLESYMHLQSNISSDQLGRFHIYASLHPDLTAGKAFNIADEDKGLSFAMVWPGIAAYFGLEGVGPVEREGRSGEKWVMEKRGEWDEWTRKNGLREKVLEKTCWDFMTVVAGEYSTFDRDFDISEARRIGFTESVDHIKGYHIAFDRMRAAKIIP